MVESYRLSRQRTRDCKSTSHGDAYYSLVRSVAERFCRIVAPTVLKLFDEGGLSPVVDRRR